MQRKLPLKSLIDVSDLAKIRAAGPSKLLYSLGWPESRLCTQSIVIWTFSEKEYIKAWGLEVAPRPVTTKGRVMPPLKLDYKASTIDSNAGVWKVRPLKQIP